MRYWKLAIRLAHRSADAIRHFGLDPSKLEAARLGNGCLAFLEFHIEQGPVLDSLGQPLGIVQAIAGQSRRSLIIKGEANHAGTTPVDLRRDALAGAAEWIRAVEARGALRTWTGGNSGLAGRAARSGKCDSGIS